MKTPVIYSNRHLREIVEDFIHSERDRKILVRKYCDNRTIIQLAEEFDLSETQIKRIIYHHSFLIFSIMEEEDRK